MSDAEQTALKPAGKKNRGLFVQWGLGFLLTAVAVFFLTRVISWEELKAAFVAVPASSLAICVAIYLFSMGLRALAWQTLLQRRVSLGRAWLVMAEGYFLNNILPLRLGCRAEEGGDLHLGVAVGFGLIQFAGRQVYVGLGLPQFGGCLQGDADAVVNSQHQLVFGHIFGGLCHLVGGEQCPGDK